SEVGEVAKVKKQDYSELRSSLAKIKAIDVVIGSEDAPITIFEYASYSCSHCANFSSRVYPKLKEEYMDKGIVRFVLRDFPLDEPSLRAAQLSRCVGDTSYEALSKTLFEQRQNWAYGKDFPEKLENIAKIVGISGDDFHACIGDKQLEEQILDYRYEVSQAYNISSTPSFIINGKKYNGNNSFAALSEYLNKIQ
ncbi:MAG: DsbA family protein, partial [Rickettsiales bacterium]|nr:DsbA family protein [Rickettsiales bacterium]